MLDVAHPLVSGLSQTPPVRWVRLLGVSVALTFLGSVISVSQASADDPSPAVTVDVSALACGDGWTGGAAGPVTVNVTDSDTIPITAYFQNADTKALYLRIEGLGSGATRTYSVSLPAGNYRFDCLTETTTVYGDAEAVTGSYDGAFTPGVLPVSEADLSDAAYADTAWVKSELGIVAKQTALLTKALQSGSVARSKSAWLVAHVTYQQLGLAYGLFSDQDTAINGLPRTDVSARTDKDLPGFHKIEALLWHGTAPRKIVSYARQRHSHVVAFQKQVDTQLFIDPADLGIRAHEILEQALRFTVTQRDDAGSHSERATLSADIAGTRHWLDSVRSVLAPRDADTDETYAWLTRLAKVLAAYHHGAQWTSYTKLSTAQHEQINAALSQTLELLSETAVVLNIAPGVSA